MAPHFTLERHLSPIPSPNGTAPHARGTFLPHSVAQRCISARSGNTSVPFRRPTAPIRTLGRHLRPFRRPMAPHRTLGEHFNPVPSPVRAGNGGRTGGAGERRGQGRSQGRAQKKGAPDIMRRPGLPEARRRPTLPTGVSVPSARAGLTALFGMGRGGTPRLKPPRISLERSQRDNDN